MPSHRAAPLSQSKREAFRQAVLRRDGPVCRMPRCLMPTRTIRLDVPHTHPASYTADHIVQVCDGGAPYDPANGRPAHRRCNTSAGARAGNIARRGKRRRTVNRLNTSKAW